ncbi:MAG: hypothetical protein JKY50_00300 [Oleispira sp.]|nr:hypothetical protein [Oleispira sp.]
MFIHGTIPGRDGKYRLNPKSGDVEFELWEAGEHGHTNPYWHIMGPGWKKLFVAGYPAEQQKSERLEF